MMPAHCPSDVQPRPVALQATLKIGHRHLTAFDHAFLPDSFFSENRKHFRHCRRLLQVGGFRAFQLTLAVVSIDADSCDDTAIVYRQGKSGNAS